VYHLNVPCSLQLRSERSYHAHSTSDEDGEGNSVSANVLTYTPEESDDGAELSCRAFVPIPAHLTANEGARDVLAPAQDSLKLSVQCESFSSRDCGRPFALGPSRQSQPFTSRVRWPACEGRGGKGGWREGARGETSS